LFPEDAERVDRDFADKINAQLAVSQTNDIVIYVHGFRNEFEDPILVSGELRHFMNYRTTALAYSWPSSTGLLSYLADAEDSESASFLFRRLIKFLARETKVRRIHIVAHSAGTRMVLGSLAEFGLEYTSSSEARIARELKLGEIILIGSDANPNKIGTLLIEGAGRVVDGLTLYVSGSDNALAVSRRIFGGRQRLGEITREPLPSYIRDFLSAQKKLNIIDVTDADAADFKNGHSYLRNSTWVSSDIIAYLAYGLSPRERGLVPPQDSHVWTFPRDYPDRIRRGLIDKNPKLVRAN
jgi:esterase/lipase superfamily enzyme